MSILPSGGESKVDLTPGPTKQNTTCEDGFECGVRATEEAQMTSAFGLRKWYHFLSCLAWEEELSRPGGGHPEFGADVPTSCCSLDSRRRCHRDLRGRSGLGLRDRPDGNAGVFPVEVKGEAMLRREPTEGEEVSPRTKLHT